MTAIDDLEVGMWVAVIGERETDRDYCECGCGRRVTKPILVDGCPLKVLAISLPFILVEAAGRKQSITVCNLNFQKLTDEYVKAYNETTNHNQNHHNQDYWGHPPTFNELFGNSHRSDDCDG